MTAGEDTQVAQPPPRFPSIDFAVDVHWVGELRVVVALSGEIDLHAAPAVERELEAAIESGRSELVVDLTHATFVDSTFLGVLVEARAHLNGSGGRLSIVCGDPRITRVFEVTGLDRLFTIHPTLAEAKRALAERP